MDQTTINEVVTALLPAKTNNMAAKIQVLYKMLQNNPDVISRFDPKGISDIRKRAKKFKKDIDPEIFKKINDIVDYFESFITMNKLSK